MTRVIPDRLPPDERAALSAELVAVATEVFGNIDPEDFRAHYLEPGVAESTSVRVFRTAAGEAAGFMIFHRYEARVGGRRAFTIRAEVCLKRAYRGHHTMVWPVIRLGLREWLRQPFTPKYYLDPILHPSSYSLFERYTPLLYPRPGADMPPEVFALVKPALDAMRSPQVGADPLVRDVGFHTREGAGEHPPDADGPSERYFKTRNPGYGEGHGLVVLVPVTLANILGGAARALGERLSRRPAPA